MAGSTARRLIPFLGSLLLFPVFLPGTAAAQSGLPAPPPGVPRTVVLPKVLIAGQRATLAVLDAAGRLVPAVDVELSAVGSVTTGPTGRAVFLAPTGTGILTARITETGFAFQAAVLAAAPEAPPEPGAAKKTFSRDHVFFPSLITLQDRFDVQGRGFSGDADLNSVVLGNLPALVLAASPVSLVALPNPRTSVGLSEISVGLQGGRPNPNQVTVISLRMAGPAQGLAPGEKGTLTVTMQGSSEKVWIEVSDLTPQIVKLRQGDAQRVFTSGGASNIAGVELQGVRSGDYALAARLVPALGALAMETARRQLLAARPFADPAWQKRLDALAQRMDPGKERFREHDPPNAARFRRELDNLLKDHPAEQVAAPLTLARQSLDGA